MWGRGLAWVCILLRYCEKIQIQNWQDMDDDQFQVLTLGRSTLQPRTTCNT
ncbi:hypothetical protein LINPERPRIM_LOCUS20160, partial [Linum perenne]